MARNGPYFEFIYHDDKVYKGWIDSSVILVHKGVLVITQSCIRDNKQGF